MVYLRRNDNSGFGRGLGIDHQKYACDDKCKSEEQPEFSGSSRNATPVTMAAMGLSGRRIIVAVGAVRPSAQA